MKPHISNWITVNTVNAAHSPMTERVIAIGAIVGLATRQATFAADARIARRKPSKRSTGTAPGTGNRYEVRFEFKMLGDCILPLKADCPTRTHAVELRDALEEMGAEKVKVKVRK